MPRADSEAYGSAVLACIKAHKSDCYQPHVASFDKTENRIEDLSK